MKDLHLFRLDHAAWPPKKITALVLARAAMASFLRWYYPDQVIEGIISDLFPEHP